MNNFDYDKAFVVDMEFMTEFDVCMSDPFELLTPQTQQAIAGRVKSQIRAVRRRLNDTRDLGYSLCAAKMVVATLQAQAEESGVPQEVLDLSDALGDDLGAVTKFLGLAREKKTVLPT